MIIQTQPSELERVCDDQGPFYCGDHISFADCMLACTLSLADMMHEALFHIDFETKRYPKLQRARDTYESDTAIAPVLAVCREATRQWIDKLSMEI